VIPRWLQAQKRPETTNLPNYSFVSFVPFCAVTVFSSQVSEVSGRLPLENYKELRSKENRDE
jgi:hypothetical protein